MDEVAIEGAMLEAIAMAKGGLGFVHHNPPVGCVILSESGKVLARGYHRFFGGPHAEIDALEKIADPADLEGATLVVTLEPCAHEGKTPSCARRLAKLPIKRVIFGLTDPNPLVAGQGAEIVRKAGIKTELFSGSQDVKDQLEDLAEIFLWHHRKRSTFVALKAAISKNGSLVTGTPDRWLTGIESREHVQFLRSQFDAVLIGVDTFLSDDPRLNVRLPAQERSNIAIVLDPKGRGLESVATSNLLKVRGPHQIYWVVGPGIDLKSHSGINLITIETGPEGFNLEKLLINLFELKIKSLFVEGGARTFASFLKQGLANRVHLFQAPMTVAQDKVLHWKGGFEGALAVEKTTESRFGVDVFTSLRLKR